MLLVVHSFQYCYRGTRESVNTIVELFIFFFLSVSRIKKSMKTERREKGT